jgi:Holliday junction resolvase RusA-like endonuclease
MTPHTAFSLDRPAVERRALAPREAIRLRLPLPPPAHVMFVDVPGLGRAPSHVNARWKRAASAALAEAPRRFLGGPVRISIAFEDKGRSDLETRAKAIVDFLVLKNVIEDDSRRVVRELVLTWGKTEGCEIAVDPLAAEQAAQ